MFDLSQYDFFETKRKRKHLDALISWESDWYRGKTDNRLYGSFGVLLQRYLDETVSSGPVNDSGVGLKHAHLINSLDVSWHLQHRVVDQLAMIHRKGVRITGSLSENINWQECKETVDLDVVLQHKLEYAIGLRSCWVRPHIEEGFPPGLVVVPPHLVTAIPFPNNPLKPMIVIEESNQGVFVWDFSEEPSFSVWKNISDYKVFKKTGTNKAIKFLSGDDYPWYFKGKPIMGGIIYQGSSSPNCLLPTTGDMVTDTLEIILERSHLRWMSYVGAFSRPVIFSESPLQGTQEAMLEPSILINLFGEGNKSMEIIPDSSVALEKYWSQHSDRIQEILGRYDTGLQVRKSESAKSGVAIQLELSGLWQYRSQQETQNKKKDKELIKILVSTWNYLYPEKYIPEDDFEIQYPISWTSDEKERLLNTIRIDVDKGIKTPVDLYLAENDLEDNTINRDMALSILILRGAERKTLIQAGLLTPVNQTIVSTPAITE